MKSKIAFTIILCLILALTLSVSMDTYAADETHNGEEHGHYKVDGKNLPLWSIIPFVGILLSIALLPLLLDSHFLVHHGGKMSLAWALIFGIPYLIAYGGDAFHDILYIYLIDYIPFIVLLWGLFTVAGGILVRGTLRGTPLVNTFLLLIGTLIASWIGTTGASMLLIRPLIRANEHRKSKVHLVVFFIFLVSNIGGSLTPLGDPPLFLGFLHNVPFFWTTTALLPHMLFISAILIVLFFIIDTFMFKREGGVVPDDGTNEPIRVDGLFNLVFLFGIIAAVLMSGTLKLGEISIFDVHVKWQNLTRDVLIVLMGLLSLMFTPFSGKLRQDNEFSWEPIEEVAKVFAGIFITIIPALTILGVGEEGALSWLIASIKEPIHYFWVTGVLSSFLDNAPTYLTFFNTALGQLQLTESVIPAIVSGELADPEHLQFVRLLTAISIGAVFMGANTYIGNAPNFMVKAIAEQSGIRMPSFFGYMLWSIVILFPLFVVVTFVFLR